VRVVGAGVIRVIVRVVRFIARVVGLSGLLS
jgi:hypothetical protein